MPPSPPRPRTAGCGRGCAQRTSRGPWSVRPQRSRRSAPEGPAPSPRRGLARRTSRRELPARSRGSRRRGASSRRDRSRRRPSYVVQLSSRRDARLRDVTHRVADRLQSVDRRVGDRDAELVLGSRGDLHHRQRVDVEVVAERLLRGDAVGRDAGDLLHDLGEAGEDVLLGHVLLLQLTCWVDVDQQTSTTWPAQVRPAPKASNSARSPATTRPSSRSRPSASGTEAADVLPVSVMSSATTASGAPSRRATASMIRRLAWCGTNAARSAGAIPAAVQAARATSASDVVAQRNTAGPSRRSLPPTGMSISPARAPSLPHTTGPMPVVSPAPTTAAPAPSPNKMADRRSVQSSQSDSFSAPATTTVRAVPARTASAATESP